MEKKTRLHTQSMHQPVITSQYLLQRLVSFLCGLNFTQTHYLIVASNLPYHTEPSLLAQATHHHAATCTVGKQFNYNDRWILRTLMMQERGFPSTSKGRILHHIYEPTEIQIMTSVGPNYVIWLSRQVTSPMCH